MPLGAVVGVIAAVAAAPSPTAAPVFLPLGFPLTVVLDAPLSSRTSRPASSIPIHLKDSLVVGGVTILRAGAPGTLTVVSVRKAIAPDRDGSIQITLAPLHTAGYGLLPIRPAHEYLSTQRSAGQDSTRALTDSAADIFVPPYVIYQVLRRGHNMVLPAGSMLPALSGASINAENPRAVIISTPAPPVLQQDEIHIDFTPIPLHTVPPTPSPSAKPTPKTSNP